MGIVISAERALAEGISEAEMLNIADWHSAQVDRLSKHARGADDARRHAEIAKEIRRIARQMRELRSSATEAEAA